jgi:hypothetical protein
MLDLRRRRFITLLRVASDKVASAGVVIGTFLKLVDQSIEIWRDLIDGASPSGKFLAALPPHDFSLLAPHLRTVPLERGRDAARRGRAEM